MKAAARKAHEFASVVKVKLDETAQKAKRVAEDEAEYPYTLSFCSLSPCPVFPSLPLFMSLIVVSLTTVLVTLRPPTKDEMQWESAKYNANATAAEGSEKAAEACETTKDKAR